MAQPRRPSLFALRLLASLLGGGCGEAHEPLPRITAFSVSPNRVAPGDAVTLSWEAADVPGVVIDPRVGLGPAVGFATDRPLATTTYVLSVPDGTGLRAEATVEVIGPPRILTFEATPTRVSAGSSTRLGWRTLDADEVEIDPGLGIHPPDGELSFGPEATTTFRLRARRGDQISPWREVRVVLTGTLPEKS